MQVLAETWAVATWFASDAAVMGKSEAIIWLS